MGDEITLLEGDLPEKQQQVYIDVAEFEQSLQQPCGFTSFCQRMNIPEAHLRKWGVGGDLQGRTYFFQRDRDHNICHERHGTFNENGTQKTDRLYFHKKPENKNHRYLPCLFGEHLLEKGKTVCIVLAERTAVIAAHYYPEFNWVATCGAGMMDERKAKVLEGFNLYVIRDGSANATRKLERTMQKLQMRYKVVDCLEGKEDKTTLADILLLEEKPDLKEYAHEPEEIGDDIRLPEGVDREDFEEHGFYEKQEPYDTGYYFYAGDHFTKQSNFIIKPLFHVYSKTDNKRLIEITNHRYTKIVDVPSKGFVSHTQFCEIVYQEGNFLFFGNKTHFLKILSKISDRFPVCEELKTLGWQREGFYAFANGIYEREFSAVDKYGIVEHGGSHYFSPAFSTIYKDVRAEDDLYENDRYFVYKSTDITFERWADKMAQVYGDNGNIAIAYFIACIFRDIVYDRFKIFPHLFLFGEKGSGKSQMGWSLQNPFLNNQPGFNLTSGTNVGFFRKLARFRNSIAWFDEYHNEIHPTRFQALKSAYDGLGHERGVMSRDNRTETTKVNSGCVISGQYLPTNDDNALYTRSIVLTFQKRQFTKADIKNYDKLKEWETEGLSPILGEILQHRAIIEKKYPLEFAQVFAKIKEDLGKEDFEERIARNFAVIITPVKLLQKEVNLPFAYKDFYQQCLERILDVSAQVTDSEGLAQFWEMVIFLLDSKQINYEDYKTREIDFKIEARDSIRVMVNRHKNEVVTFDTTRKVLYLRLAKIFPLYMEAYRKQHGHNGIDKTSLQNYFVNHKAYLGLVKSTGFENGKSSAHAFDYELLNVNLDRSGGAEDTPPADDRTESDTQKDLPF